jgi:nuclear pore complex protein Nup160
VFKHQLELGHNQEAFMAMMANPDPLRRKDCLRQLVVVLSERGELQDLVQFPYKDLEEEVRSLVFNISFYALFLFGCLLLFD